MTIARSLLLLSTSAVLCRAETFTVTSADSGIGPGTLATMIAGANASLQATVTIEFALSTDLTISTNGTAFEINRPMTINGPSANRVTLYASPNTPVFRINPAAAGQVTVNNLILHGGGGVFNGGDGGVDGGLVKVEGASGVSVAFNTCDFLYALSEGRGGACFVNGGATASFNRCLFQNCEAYGNGGGVCVIGSTAVFRTCRFKDNLSMENGGGIFAMNSTVDVVGCTLTGNSAGSRKYAVSTNDDAGDGGGIRAGGTSSVTLVNTVVAGNVDIVTSVEHNDLSGDFISSGHNFIGIRDGATGFGILNIPPPQPSDQAGTAASPKDPQLDPQDTPYWTSPLRDAGDNAAASGFLYDQAGNERIINGTVDIGAMEAENGLVVTTSADSGAGSLRQILTDLAVFAPTINQPPSVITFDPVFFNTARTITLLSTLPQIRGGITLDASMTRGVTIDGQGLHAILRWEDDAIAQDNVLDSLHFTRGVSPGNGIAAAVSLIDSQDTLLMRRCTVSGCRNGVSLGAVTSAGSFTMENCTLSGNYSNIEQAGNAVHGNATLVHCTVVNAGESSPFTSATLLNCFVTGHTPGRPPLTLTGASSIGGNVTDTAFASPKSSDLTFSRSGTFPAGLGALTMNGGLVATHALTFDSAGIDRGLRSFATVSLPARDARNQLRLKGTEPDAGAYEWTPINYGAWQALVFTGPTAPSAAQQAVKADPDRDGIPNAVEFYTGTDPNTPNKSPLTLTLSGNTATLSYPVARGRLVQNAGFRGSIDLLNWNALPASFNPPAQGAASGVTDTWSITGQKGGAKGFYRLEVNP